MIKIGKANSVTRKVNKEITANHDINSWCVCIHPKMTSNLSIGQPFNTEIIQAAFRVDLQASPEDKLWESHLCVDRDYTLHGARGYYYIWRSIKNSKSGD